MTLMPIVLLSLPISLMLLAGLVPSGLADRYVVSFRRLVPFLAAIQFLSALGSAVWAVVSGGWNWTLAWDEQAASLLPLSLYYDGVTGLMLLMVSFVGLVACTYSVRYLDGEATQGRYFRWIAFTIGAVSLMVVSGNLLLFFLAWIGTSLGLHRLLLHYPQRPAAQGAAWTKFCISRIGDVFLISALILTYTNFGTLELAAIFETLSASTPTAPAAGQLTAIAWLLMLGAVTKSAQFPFHTWLPETMETPTPVSALMHAGIVNAGGYLVIRMSPLVTQAPAALTALCLIGTFTACFAGIVMLTQSSVKRALAYSTIAQMGFMMLQCGLGAFSAAMLHILAHSLYKAHAFLSSGSVLQQARATSGAKFSSPPPTRGVLLLAIAAGLTFGSLVATSLALGLDLSDKPGGYVLGFVLCLALATWGWRAISGGTFRTATAGLLTLAALSLVYVASYLAVDKVVAGSLPDLLVTEANWLTMGVPAASFCLLFGLHWLLIRNHRPAWFDAIYVHASNGFYVDVAMRRMSALLAKA